MGTLLVDFLGFLPLSKVFGIAEFVQGSWSRWLSVLEFSCLAMRAGELGIL